MSTTTLFEPIKPAEPAKPEQPPDFYNLYIPTIANVPPGWAWYQLDCSDGAAPKGFNKVTGAVAPLKSNGQHDWRKEERGTKSIHFIEFKKFHAWIEEYAKSLGRCPKCWNSGLQYGHRPCERGCATPVAATANEGGGR